MRREHQWPDLSPANGATGGLSGLGSKLFSRGAQGGLGGTPQYFDHLGQRLLTDDFNSDGRADLAIGVPQWATSGSAVLEDSGLVILVFSGANGLTGTGVRFVSQGLEEGRSASPERQPALPARRRRDSRHADQRRTLRRGPGDLTVHFEGECACPQDAWRLKLES